MNFRKNVSTLLAGAMTAIDLLFGKSLPTSGQNLPTPTDTPLEPENTFCGVDSSAPMINVCCNSRDVRASAGSSSESENELPQRNLFNLRCFNPCSPPHADQCENPILH